MKRFSALALFLFFFVWRGFFVPAVFAARAISITGNKTSLLGDEELTITALTSGFTNGETILIKGAFFQPVSSGAPNYFGFTKSGDNWIKNSASNSEQRAVKIGDWDGTIIVKSDFTDSGYKGEGDYALKVGFYYGSYASVTWSTSSALPVTINEPDPTPTSTPMPTSTCTPTPTSSSTPTPTHTPTPTKTPTPSIASDSGDVLSDSSGSGESPVADTIEPSGTVSGQSISPIKIILIPLVSVGLGLAILSGVLIWKKHNTGTPPLP